MTSTLSLATLVAKLEEQIAFHREREAFHAEQEVLHRERRAAHAAELEALTSNLEAFKAAAAAAVELASRAEALSPPPPQPAPNLDIGRKPSLRRMIDRVVEARPAGEAFGTSAVAAEINRLYKDRLRRPVKEKLVSITLRRMLAAGELRSVRKGRPHHEALYARVEAAG